MVTKILNILQVTNLEWILLEMSLLIFLEEELNIEMILIGEQFVIMGTFK